MVQYRVIEITDEINTRNYSVFHHKYAISIATLSVTKLYFCQTKMKKPWGTRDKVQYMPNHTMEASLCHFCC